MSRLAAEAFVHQTGGHCCRSGRSRGPTVEGRTSCLSRWSRFSTVSTFIHRAASSSASGNASSWRQIAVTVGLFAGVKRKLGCTSLTRSTKSRIAGVRARSAGGIVSAPTSKPRGPTAYSRSPRTRSGARLVTSTLSGKTHVRRSAISDEASRTCSKLSATSNVTRRAFFGHLAREFERQTRLPHASRSRESHQAYGGIGEPMVQCPQVGIAAEQRGQRDAAEFIDRRVVNGCPRAPH